MNVSKAIVKVDLAKSIGAKYASMTKEAENSRLRQEGARDAIKEAAKRVGDLGLQLDKAFEDGELPAADLKDPKKIEIFIKRWNRRAVGVLDNLATTAEMARVQATGRVKGLQAAEEYVRKLAEAEVSRLEELQRQLDSGEVVLEDVESGGHPGLSLKHQREDQRAVEAVNSEVTSEPVLTKSEGLDSGAKEKSRVKSSAKPKPKKRPVPKRKKPTSKKE